MLKIPTQRTTLYDNFLGVAHPPNLGPGNIDRCINAYPNVDNRS